MIINVEDLPFQFFSYSSIECGLSNKRNNFRAFCVHFFVFKKKHTQNYHVDDDEKSHQYFCLLVLFPTEFPHTFVVAEWMDCEAQQ